MAGGKSFNLREYMSSSQFDDRLILSLIYNEPDHRDDGFAEHTRCPSCGSDNVRKYGHSPSGEQRFQCIDCNRTFLHPERNPRLKYTKLGMDTWRRFLECQVRGLSARDSAKVCGVSIPTVYSMRARVIEILEDLNGV